MAVGDPFSVSIDTRGFQQRLAGDRIPEAMRAALRPVIIGLTKEMRDAVIAKLNGPVLNRRSGKLIASIKSRMVENPKTIYGQVFSDGSVPYAAIHEYGGTTRPHEIVPKNASALAFYWPRVGANVIFKRVMHPGSKIPQRSYMRSTLDEHREEIIERMTRAARRAAGGVV